MYFGQYNTLVSFAIYRFCQTHLWIEIDFKPFKVNVSSYRNHLRWMFLHIEIRMFLHIELLEFIRTSSNSVFNCHNSKGIKLITRLRLGLSHLREHKLRHNFQDTLNPICSWGVDRDYNSFPTSLSKLLRWKEDTLEQPSKYWRKHSW